LQCLKTFYTIRELLHIFRAFDFIIIKMKGLVSGNIGSLRGDLIKKIPFKWWVLFRQLRHIISVWPRKSLLQ